MARRATEEVRMKWSPDSKCDSVHMWQLHSTAPLANLVASIMTQYPTQLHYSGSVLTSPCPILIIPSARLGSDKYQFYK